MLSRTADHLFWMARYTERAENTARMLDVTVQTSLLPQSLDAAEESWRAMLGICELQSLYDSKHKSVTSRNVLDFMVRDPDNPSSIASCLTGARENARAVRGTLTTEVWETKNTTWLEMQRHLADGMLVRDPSEFFEWVKFRSHLSRGVTIGTTLKDEAFYFIRLGTFLERADNTARILDVKFHNAKPVQRSKRGAVQRMKQSGAAGEQVMEQGLEEPIDQESRLDFYYWAAILRSVSGFEIYRKVYRDVITPARVAELLMLRADMPRSLLHCMEEVVLNLSKVRNDLSADTERLAGRLHAELRFVKIEEILEEGLHGYLTEFLERVFELGNSVSADFMLPSAA